MNEMKGTGWGIQYELIHQSNSDDCPFKCKDNKCANKKNKSRECKEIKCPILWDGK